ncbi:hypothetical protein GGU10DRAFT_337499 [Lentinula aff. detonsa]|uniref:Uncharacterized protein n=2 Tax=Lentinula TaxID=5352 RepID=A0AA38KD07_9AGAR|nr:hypothetical protein GGU10DRAFT_337499 [Lentinula aff. detonsa]KAJ3978988.1 hypothetical protein F5890DRAFT_1478894 [Lentinula detonsa]
MKNVTYEVGFIRSATRVSAEKGVWDPLNNSGRARFLKLKASIKSAKPPRTRMLPQGASKAVSKNVNPGPTGIKGPSKNSLIIDPLALWLPPDRLGFNSQNWEVLYEVVCSSIDAAQIGISGKDFFKAIKKARKELCKDFLGRVVTSCPCNKKSYCAACTVAMLKEDYKHEQFRCPCCRQDPAYFIAIDWIFINKPDEQKRCRALSKKQREITKKKRLREAKREAQELAEDELEEGELRE